MSKKGLTGRVALIAGGSRGIGKVIALTLAEHGADIIICGRDKITGEKTAEAIRTIGVESYFKSIDATQPDEVRQLFERAVATMGGLDILVNNIGGVREINKFWSLDDAAWYEIFETNFMTTVRVTREAIPWLKKSPCARIINIASLVAKQPGDWNPHYGAMKAAMVHLSKSLARTLGPGHITVNAICPSTIKGEGAWHRDVESRADQRNLSFEAAERQLEEEVKAKATLPTIGIPEDVAGLVAFLASDEGRFITGTCIQVDGGTVRSIF